SSSMSTVGVSGSSVGGVIGSPLGMSSSGTSTSLDGVPGLDGVVEECPGLLGLPGFDGVPGLLGLPGLPGFPGLPGSTGSSSLLFVIVSFFTLPSLVILESIFTSHVACSILYPAGAASSSRI